MLSDFKIQAMGDADILSEPVKGRGNGVLYFKRKGLVTEVFYRYTFEGKRPLIKIDNYKPPKKRSGSTLSELRDKAGELANLRRDHPNLKIHLEQVKREEDNKLQEKSKRGSFKEMADSYVLSLTEETKKAVKRYFYTDIFKCFPELKDKKAADITTDDLVSVLKFHH